jgi:hypothetical protein
MKKLTTTNEGKDLTKKIVLSVADRFNLQSLLPKNGRMVEMEIVKNITDRVRFSPSEIEEYEIRDLDNGSVIWNSKTAKETEYRFEDSEITVLQKGVNTCDKNSEITQSNLDLAKRILALKKSKEESDGVAA